MTLADVLAAKGRGVVTLRTTQRLEDAIRIFDDRHIAAVVVVDPERRPLGIIPEREAVHAIARHGASALTLGVSHVMISPPPMCTPDVRVSDALRRMTGDRIRHLIVMNEEEMLGIVSIGDLVKVRLEDADMEGRVLRDMALTHLAND
jgi:CBS domain-containing protein